MTAIKMITSFNVLSKKRQLSSGASALPIKPRCGKPGFTRTDFGNFPPAVFDLTRNFAQERGPFNRCGLRIAFKGRCGGLRRAVHILCCADRKMVNNATYRHILKCFGITNPMTRD